MVHSSPRIKQKFNSPRSQLKTYLLTRVMAVRLLKGMLIAYSSSLPSSVSRLLRCTSSNFCSWEGPNNKKKICSDGDRLSGVIDATNDRKLPPELRGQRNNVRSETDIINVVEQRIWRSMEEGHFENLPGKGKPLNLDSNPHADPAEDTLYRILSKNNCAPEWVELNKGIRNDVATWRLTLKKAVSCKESGDMSKWDEYSTSLKVKLRSINDKVFRYNLIVPFGRQMHGLNWEKELARLNEVQPGT